jgi:hypothetical protein
MLGIFKPLPVRLGGTLIYPFFKNGLGYDEHYPVSVERGYATIG